MTESIKMAESLNCDSNGTMGSGNVMLGVGNVTAIAHKDKALCDRQNSEILMRLYSTGAPDKSGTTQIGIKETGATETKDTGTRTEYDPLWNAGYTRAPNSKSTYVVLDQNVDVANVRGNNDVVVVVKPSSNTELSAGDKVRNSKTSRVCWFLVKLFLFIFLCVLTSIFTHEYIAPRLTPDRKIPVLEEGKPRVPLAEKHTGPRPNNDESHSRHFNWATYYMDQDRFTKGMAQLPWKAEQRSKGIHLTDNGCFKVPKTSVYEVYSKITFQFTAENKTGPGVSIYHNVQRCRGGDCDMLDKNRFTAPYRPKDETKTLFQTSSLIVFSEFEAGDTIRVSVGDTSLVYESETDNTVKIIQRGD